MISYEIAMGMAAVAVLLLAGNVTLSQVVARQQDALWFVLPLAVAWIVFLVAAFAETNRVPFDLPEAEGELVAGYHTEYSAMKFSMFYIAEYSNMVTASALMTSLFFGGWDIPFTTWDETPPWTVAKTLATLAMFLAKTGFFLFLHLGALDGAAVPLRPADGPGLEGAAAAGARVPRPARHRDLVPARGAAVAVR
jgi:NADH-quinone oxidoreductase subunit H